MVADKFHLALMLGSLVLLLLVGVLGMQDCNDKESAAWTTMQDEEPDQSFQEALASLERVERLTSESQLRILNARVTLLEQRLESIACRCCYELDDEPAFNAGFNNEDPSRWLVPNEERK